MKKHQLTTTVHMPEIEIVPERVIDKAFCDKILYAVAEAMGVPRRLVEPYYPPKNGVFIGVIKTKKGKQ